MGELVLSLHSRQRGLLLPRSALPALEGLGKCQKQTDQTSNQGCFESLRISDFLDYFIRSIL